MILAALASGGRAAPIQVPISGIISDDNSVLRSISSFFRSARDKRALFDCAEAYRASDHVDQSQRLILDVRTPGLSGLDVQGPMSWTGPALPINSPWEMPEAEHSAKAQSPSQAIPRRGSIQFDSIRSKSKYLVPSRSQM
jgi:hypothetical protein